MAEEYIIGSNAQFNDSVEILKDLTLYGVVENTTDFAVKIQGDEKLRITSDGITFTDTLTALSVTAPSGIFSGIITATNVSVAQSVTANEYYGTFKGSIDPTVANDKISEGNSSAEVVDTGSDGHFKVITEGDEILRITSTGLEVQKNGVPAIISNYNNSKHIQMDAGDNGAGFQLTTGNYFAINHQPYADRGTNNNLTERLRILSGGMLVRGHTESAGQIDTQLNSQNQFHGNDRKGGIRITDFSNSQFSAGLQFVKSRNPTIDQNTILQDGDHMGSIYWGGANGTNYQPGAFLVAKTDGTVSSTAMPTALSFGTNEGNNLVERLRIDPDGRLTCFGTNAQDIIHISTGNLSSSTFGNIRGDNKAGIRIRGGGSYGGGMIELAGGLRDTDPAVIKFHTGTDVTANNDEHMRITSTGRVLINTTSSINSQAYLEIQGGTSHGQTNYIQTWKGDSDNIAIRNQALGDYEFTNSQQGNQLAIYDGTGGVRCEYADGGNYVGMYNNFLSSNRAHAATTSSSANLNITGSASYYAIRRSTSSQRYKDNIREYVGLGVSAIKQMIPKLWEDHNEGFTKLGFIAEDIHNIGLTNAVEYEEYIGGSEIGIGVTYGDMYGNGTTPVTKTGEALDDEVLVVDGIDNTAIIAELVIAVKQLTARIETLESGG